MKRPYIICHMMSSVDGRIDCAMTAKLAGVDEYYKTLDLLDVQATVSGRVTAQLEMAEAGEFVPKNSEAVGAEKFSKKSDAEGWSVVADTKGRLLWNSAKLDGTPLLVLSSERVSKEYLEYLDAKGISWIVSGKDKIDLARVCEILAAEFGVKRMAIVGGPTINAGFLAAGLLDEVSLLIGPGIDGRTGMPGVFDGLPNDKEPTVMQLTGVSSYDDGAVWLRYKLA